MTSLQTWRIGKGTRVSLATVTMRNAAPPWPHADLVSTSLRGLVWKAA